MVAPSFAQQPREALRVRVKICGITRPCDALGAARAGADAIGLVFYPLSPRLVTVEQALGITKVLPPFVTRVGLFADQTEAMIRATLEQVPLDLLQFHGEETPAQCRRYKRPYLKALRVRAGIDVRRLCAAYEDATGWLLDSFVPGKPGGTGVTFNWSLIPSGLGRPVVLAGGLTPDNVAEAITRVRPYGVDVSGGVECAKGIKDEVKMWCFMRSVRNAGERNVDECGA